MGGLTGGKSNRILCTSVSMVQKSVDFLAAEEWIKREWPKIVLNTQPKTLNNADEIRLYFRAMPENAYLFKHESAKRFYIFERAKDSSLLC
jgi:hypothetical protein